MERKSPDAFLDTKKEKVSWNELRLWLTERRVTVLSVYSNGEETAAVFPEKKVTSQREYAIL